MFHTLSTIAAQAAAKSRQAADFTVVVRKTSAGPELTREAVADGDLSDIFDQLWLDDWLRRGQPRTPIEDLSLQIVPEHEKGNGQCCIRFLFQATDRQGRLAQIMQELEAFQDVAGRAARRLMAAEMLKAEDTYFYEIHDNERLAPATAVSGPDSSLKVTMKNPPLEYVPLQIRTLLERASPIGSPAEGDLPVFYTAEALKRSEYFARKGAAHHPPTETGAVLAGWLCSCPESGELFIVITDALEVWDAESSEYSLNYSSKTWNRIQAVIKARQVQAGSGAYRILGQSHGHNFMPAGNSSACANCREVKECKLSSVFVSLDDRIWSRAVFNRQPWHVCQIFGMNARGENVARLYSLRDNRLAPRGFHLIADFDPGLPATGHPSQQI